MQKHNGYKKVPLIVLQLCNMFDAVVVGSSAILFAEDREIQSPRPDIDVIVPIDKWVMACKIIPQGARVNSFGGFAFEAGGFKIDVWADDAARVLLKSPMPAGCIWSPVYGNKALLKRKRGRNLKCGTKLS